MLVRALFVLNLLLIALTKDLGIYGVWLLVAMAIKMCFKAYLNFIYVIYAY